MYGCLSCVPYSGFGQQPKHVPSLGIKPATLWFTGWHSIHWPTPARADWGIFKMSVRVSRSEVCWVEFIIIAVGYCQPRSTFSYTIEANLQECKLLGSRCKISRLQASRVSLLRRAQRRTVSLNSHGETTSTSHDKIDFTQEPFTEVRGRTKGAQNCQNPPGTSNIARHCPAQIWRVNRGPKEPLRSPVEKKLWRRIHLEGSIMVEGYIQCQKTVQSRQDAVKEMPYSLSHATLLSPVTGQGHSSRSPGNSMLRGQCLIAQSRAENREWIWLGGGGGAVCKKYSA